MPVTINGSAGVTTNSGAIYNGIQGGTAVASTSGTSIDFTGIPSWVKRITVMFNGVSLSGTSNTLVQLGTSGGIVSTGYIGSSVLAVNTATSSGNSFSTGIGLFANNATQSVVGMVTFCALSGNTWVASGAFGFNANQFSGSTGGAVTLSGTLDRIRITTVNGTDTFDAGSINILYE